MSRSINPQLDQFTNELDRLVERFANEYDLSFAEVVGALNFKIYLLQRQAQTEYEEES